MLTISTSPMVSIPGRMLSENGGLRTISVG